jgi:hypothetical protein
VISDRIQRSLPKSVPDTSHLSLITSHFSPREPKASAAFSQSDRNKDYGSWRNA